MSDEAFTNWLEGAPVLPLAAPGDFSRWLDGAPVTEGGEGTNPPADDQSQRRRCFTAFIS